ncbi:MAG: hypothetical protein JO055_07225 [Alphaproteobacteria bacterium]|nr:hypothetical protein [Alphaproteobacteria bacterium]
MREDMSRLIVERPRKGGNFGRKGRAVALENLPTKVGLRRYHAEIGPVKGLNENLAPLRRYLESQVGRPWNKVFSDIARHVRVDSTVQQHVRQHLDDFVAVNPRRDVVERWRRPGQPWRQPLYVDPDDGLLKRTDRLLEVRRARRVEKEKPAPPATMLRLSDERVLQRIDGLWYEVSMKKLPDPQYRPVVSDGVEIRRLCSAPVLDVVRYKEIQLGPPVDDARSWRAYNHAHRDRRYAAAKRSLSSAELKRHGLSNETPAP